LTHQEVILANATIFFMLARG